MNRTKMIHQLDRTFPDQQILYVDAFDVHNQREMMEIAEQFFGYCKKVWGRKYDSRTHVILFEQEFDIDYNRFVLVARVRKLEQQYVDLSGFSYSGRPVVPFRPDPNRGAVNDLRRRLAKQQSEFEQILDKPDRE